MEDPIHGIHLETFTQAIPVPLEYVQQVRFPFEGVKPLFQSLGIFTVYEQVNKIYVQVATKKFYTKSGV